VLPGCVGTVSPFPVRTSYPHCLQSAAVSADQQGMNTMVCRSVAQAGLAAGTASLDREEAWPLLLVAGWLTTAADLMKEAELRETAPA